MTVIASGIQELDDQALHHVTCPSYLLVPVPVVVPDSLYLSIITYQYLPCISHKKTDISRGFGYTDAAAMQ